jgi:MOSC domain-containing protein YiiM
MPGIVTAIHLCVGSRQPMKRVESAEARGDFGLWGDRHARAGHARQVLLMEQEVLDLLGLEPGIVRENVTTRGIALTGLPAGTRLRAGGALLEITGPCQPCARMDEIRPGLKDHLEGRRGMLCRVLEGGPVKSGDAVQVDHLAGSPPAARG